MTGKQILMWISFVISLFGLFRMIMSDPDPVMRTPEGADSQVIEEFGRETGALPDL